MLARRRCRLIRQWVKRGLRRDDDEYFLGVVPMDPCPRRLLYASGAEQIARGREICQQCAHFVIGLFG